MWPSYGAYQSRVPVTVSVTVPGVSRYPYRAPLSRCCAILSAESTTYCVAYQYVHSHKPRATRSIRVTATNKTPFPKSSIPFSQR